MPSQCLLFNRKIRVLFKFPEMEAEEASRHRDGQAASMPPQRGGDQEPDTNCLCHTALSRPVANSWTCQIISITSFCFQHFHNIFLLLHPLRLQNVLGWPQHPTGCSFSLHHASLLSGQHLLGPPLFFSHSAGATSSRKPSVTILVKIRGPLL